MVCYTGEVSCPKCGGFNTKVTGGDDGGVYYKCNDCGCAGEEYGCPIVHRIIGKWKLLRKLYLLKHNFINVIID